MRKTLAKIWLWTIGAALVVGNGIACYKEHSIFWTEAAVFGLIALALITTAAIVELTDDDEWYYNLPD